MAIRNIVYDDNDLLLKQSKRVVNFDEKLWELLDDMKETMNLHNGVGIAAVQVGVLKRAVLVSINNLFLEMINPEILEQSGNQCGVEGCLSIKNIQGYVNRPSQVTVKAQDRYGYEYVITAVGDLAVVMCHEIDHTNGILFTSKMIKRYIPGEKEENNI
jgi:peptide deformylase